MSPEPRHSELDESTLRQLAQLADGTLQGLERVELEARVAHSPILRGALERQRLGAGALRGLDLPATPGLRARLEAQAAPPPRRRRRRRFAIAGAIAGAAATLALAAVLIVPSSDNATVLQASRLSEAPATGSVGVDPGNERLLAADVEGVAFPNWSDEFGWHEAGTRTDRLDGRSARTVFYESARKRVAYTIISGEGIPAPGGSSPVTRNGVRLHSLADGVRRVVTWWRDGRTCVLSSADVGDPQLIKLASWKGDGAVPF
jgi:hypothetical protein